MKVAINAEHAQYSSVYYDCEYPKSLIAVSICAEVTLWDSSGTIQGILLKASNSHSISRLKSDIHSYVYSISKVTAKNLLMKYSEAKDLFFTDSIQSSNESLRKSGDLPPIAKRNPHVRLFQNDSLEGSPIKKSQEITESFEYSVSDETEKYGKSENIEKVATKGKKNYNFTLKRDSLEVESPRFTSLESMENDKGILNNVRVRTPEASPRQFECPSHQVKFILKLKDSNVDMITSKSMDLEKTTLKTTITEPSHKLEDRASCYNCEVCYIF